MLSTSSPAREVGLLHRKQAFSLPPVAVKQLPFRDSKAGRGNRSVCGDNVVVAFRESVWDAFSLVPVSLDRRNDASKETPPLGGSGLNFRVRQV